MRSSIFQASFLYVSAKFGTSAELLWLGMYCQASLGSIRSSSSSSRCRPITCDTVIKLCSQYSYGCREVALSGGEVCSSSAGTGVASDVYATDPKFGQQLLDNIAVGDVPVGRVASSVLARRRSSSAAHDLGTVHSL